MEPLNGDGNNMTEAVAGRFWLPEAPEHEVSGYFRSFRGGIRVELNGELTPSLREVDRTVQPGGGMVISSTFADDGPRNSITVHGRLNDSSEKLTLLRCFTIHRKGKFFGHADDEQHLRAMYAVRGAYITGIDEQFTAFRVRFQHLDVWAGLGGFESDRQGNEKKLTYREFELPSVDLASGGIITLDQDIKSSHPTTRGGDIRRTVWFSLSAIDMTWEELGRLIATPLASLLTLCTGRPCTPLAYQGQTQAGEWVQVEVGLAPPEADELESHEVMVKLADIALDGVARWLNKTEDLGPLPPVVASAVSASNIRIETFLLELTTVAEGLHSRLFREECRTDPDTAERIKDKVAGVLQDEDPSHLQAVKGLLQFFEEPSYPKRMRRLAEETAIAVPGITGDTRKWIDVVNACRNEFAHRRAGFVSNADLDKYYGVIVSLRWVLAGMLLLQTGIDPSRLAARVTEDQSFNYFLSQAVEYLPDIYQLT